MGYRDMLDVCVHPSVSLHVDTNSRKEDGSSFQR